MGQLPAPELVQRSGSAALKRVVARSGIIDNMHRSERWLGRQYDRGAMLRPRSVLSPDTTGTDLEASEARAVSRLRQRVAMLATALESFDARTCPYNPFRRYASRSPVSRVIARAAGLAVALALLGCAGAPTTTNVTRAEGEPLRCETRRSPAELRFACGDARFDPAVARNAELVAELVEGLRARSPCAG